VSNSADGKNIQFTIRILASPTLSITVTETVVKAHEVYGGRQKRWKSTTKAPIVATQLSRALSGVTWYKSTYYVHATHIHIKKFTM